MEYEGVRDWQKRELESCETGKLGEQKEVNEWQIYMPVLL